VRKIRYRLYNINIDIFNKDEELEICKEMLDGEKCNLLYFINAHCFNIAQKNNIYKNTIMSADLVLNDGIGIEIACKLAKIPVKQNMNGTDFIPEIINLASRNKKRIYILGGKGEIPLMAKINLEKGIKDVNIVGYHNGYFNKEEEENIIREINDKKVDLIIVGMGVPIQEIWLYNNKNKFTTVKLCVAGGAIFDFIAGEFRRAPKFLIKLRLEWVYRLYNEPKRLWRRYLIGNLRFLYYIFFNKEMGNVLRTTENKL
jgi:N-acetylglucosaminyldiphosphoundecaprenol N-acetyl-beta-D-mannosaminyltransferase